MKIYRYKAIISIGAFIATCGNIAAAQAQTDSPKAPTVPPKAPAAKPAKKGFTLSGSVRIREEFWDWFKPATGNYKNNYAFTGAILRVAGNYTGSFGDAKLELAAPFLGGLPKTAAAPAPQGLLGLGGLYRAVNGAQNGSVFVKQGYVQAALPGKQSVKAGRFEFSDAGETVPGNPTLAYIKRERLAQRLIGPFAWAHVGRSFDGLQYVHNRPNDNLTVVTAYPTRGVFDLDGAATITAVRFAYAALTLPHYKKGNGSEARLFALYYTDTRDVAKTDNAAKKDRDDIKLTTIGAHYLAGGLAGAGRWDALLWGAYQTGKWGKLDNAAYAYTAEAGYQFGKVPTAPHLRAGYFVASGDNNASDSKHKTFYAPLSTPRIYARTPFYTESNVVDTFVQAILRPTSKVLLRADAHRLSLANSHDLWYSADGPFQTRPYFGLFGRPSGGKSDLADLIDLSADVTATPRDTFTLYVGAMQGRGVVKNSYPTDTRGTYSYLEITHRF